MSVYRYGLLDRCGDFARSPQAVRLAWAGAVRACAGRPSVRPERGRRRVLAGVLLGLAMSWMWVASAWGAAPGSQCIRLVEESGREILLNTCTDCRSVDVSRKRPGSQPANTRSYMMAGESRMTLPFRGPGHTRVVAETACTGADDQMAGEDRKCVTMHNTADRGMVLVNGCQVCRKVDFERIHAGGDRTTQVFTIPRNGHVPAPSHGARFANIASDEPCRQ